MRRDLRLLPIAGGAWAAALICVFAPGMSWGCVGGGAVGAGICGWVLVRRTAGAAVWGVLLVVCAAGAAVSVSAALAGSGREDVASWSGRVVEATAEITSSASIGQDGRLWVEVALTGIGPPGEVRAASAPARIGIEPGEGFDLGASMRVTGEAEGTDAGERSALIVFASAASVERPASGVFSVAAGLRLAFVERSLRLPSPGSALLPGLAVGDTRAVSTELNDAMRTSGLSHLTAVSGANCAIVVGAVFWLAALCGAGRRIRVVLAALALGGFVVLVTPEPSVIRAGVMAGVAMLTILLGRPSAGAGMLALSATGILIADPWLAATPGFALSVVASGSLILLAPLLARGLARWMPQPLALALAVPVAAQLACGPIIALFAEQQSLVGVAANLLAAPAAPIATVIGLLACLAAPVPPLADLLAASAWLPSAWIATTAEMAASLPFAEVLVPPGLLTAAVVAVVSAAVAVVLAGGLRRFPIVRAAAASVLSVMLALGAAHLVLSGPLSTMTTPSGWAIAMCDIGQGDAVVVRSAQRIALIDTGPDPAPLASCLRALGVDRIDLLVLTHFDLDHVGGVDAVQGRVDVVLHGPPGESADQEILARLADGGAKIEEGAVGVRGTLGEAEWRVLWPVRDERAFAPGNDLSVVVEFESGGVPRSLFLGDLSAEPQAVLLRSGRVDGAYPVVKVSHHGSGDQDAELYARITAAVGLIGVGADNDYGHPRADALAMLAAAGTAALRTDQQGRVLVGVREGKLEVWTERASP
ncbi:MULTISPECIES: ComEC/Rec2 family competence protein [unclassified Microbacterium]|uniref:ComEC/Rec2 family competence protein n=1 Tax=unclassified Microbacterium TaxID=2609290 RepID=UPI0034236D8C